MHSKLTVSIYSLGTQAIFPILHPDLRLAGPRRPPDGQVHVGQHGLPDGRRQDAEPGGAPAARRVQGAPLHGALHDARRAVAGGARHAAAVGQRVIRRRARQRAAQGRKFNILQGDP